MRLLIIGGTIFLGRHLVETARAAGHTVTLFNRGKHGPDLFPELERITGDRDTDLDLLGEREWDAVIDTCGYVPRLVGKSATALSKRVKHYTFISSISVYADFSRPRMDETAPVGTLEDTTTEQITNETYGPLKALCEQAAETAMPGRVLNVRAGMIVGPHDPSDRFTYWPVRTARGGEMLVPGTPDQPMDLIDVRDLAEWILRMIETDTTGIYNVAGPDHTQERLTMRQVLECSRTLSGSDARFTYIPGPFLETHELSPNSLNAWYLPDEVVDGEPDYLYIWDMDYTRAQQSGLTYRPLTTTVQDTLAWATTLPPDRSWRISLAAEREKEILEAWKKTA